MPHQQYLHLHKQITRHGKVVWYVRIAKGQRTRLRAPYGSDAFNAEYRAALLADKRPPKIKASKGTLEWLWMLYRQSESWAQLEPATRKQRENIMVHVLATGGSAPISAIGPDTIQDGIDRRSVTPFAARNFLLTMRGLFRWAVTKRFMRSDPTVGIKTTKPKTNGFPEWTEEDVERYEKRWPIGTRERVMFDVFMYTGLRRGDAAVVGKQHLKDGIISLQTEKTGMWVHIPLLPVLKRTLDAGPTGDLAWIATTRGNPMAKESLGNAFRDACRDAGIEKSAHGLRKAAATRAADNGATEAQLEAIFGWSGGHMAALYTRAANRRRLAREAMNKLEKGTPAPSPALGEGKKP